MEYFDRPHMGFVQAIKAFFQNYAKFDGRAGRSDWWFALLNFLVTLVIYGVGMGTGGTTTAVDGQINAQFGTTGSFLMVAWGLATLVPTVAVVVRRLHDTNRSGWFYLIGFVPFVGPFILLFFLAQQGNGAGARFDGQVAPKIGK